MVRELCWISLAKQVVINRMTFGNNYQPSSLPPFSSHTLPLLCHFYLPLIQYFGLTENGGGKMRLGEESSPCCCCLRLQCELNFQIRLILWKWDWPVALLWKVGRQDPSVAGSMCHSMWFLSQQHANMHSWLRSLQRRWLFKVWANCHQACSHARTRAEPTLAKHSMSPCNNQNCMLKTTKKP